MKLVSIKSAADFPLNGIIADFVKEDGTLKRVELRDAAGNAVTFSYENYSSLKVLVAQPYESAERYQLSGSFLGVADIREFYESESDAKEKLREYENKAGGRDSGLSIEKVNVLINDAGDVVAAGVNGVTPPAARHSDIPF